MYDKHETDAFLDDVLETLEALHAGEIDADTASEELERINEQYGGMVE